MLQLPTVLALAGALSSFAVTAQQTDQAVLNASPVKVIPLLGFGTWNLKTDEASDAVTAALQAGYRHIDGAFIYGNEKEVRKGIKEGLEKTGLRREDIWVTSKLWNDKHAPEDVPKALNKTIEDLGVGYLDLYLMHWPVASANGLNEIDYVDTYTAMTKLLATKKVRHIGVSNFSPTQLTALLASHPRNKPYAHQLETHPYLPQDGFLATHKTLGIHVTAYSPLGNMNPTYTSWRKERAAEAVPPLLDNDIVKSIAEDRDCTPAQVALAWGMKRGTSVIPKSKHEDRIIENYETVEKCRLEKSDFKRLEELPVKRFNNPSKAWGVPLYDGLQDSASIVAEDAKKGKQCSEKVLGLESLRSSVEAFVNRLWRTVLAAVP